MGKRKKRRGMNTDENTVNEDSTQTVSDNSSVSHDRQDSSLVSNILSVASYVLYGSPFNLTKSKTETRNDNGAESEQMTSMPISREKEKNRTRTQDNEVRKALDTMNSKIDSVLEKLSKLDIVEKRLNEITADVAHLGKK